MEFTANSDGKQRNLHKLKTAGISDPYTMLKTRFTKEPNEIPEKKN